MYVSGVSPDVFQSAASDPAFDTDPRITCWPEYWFQKLISRYSTPTLSLASARVVTVPETVAPPHPKGSK